VLLSYSLSTHYSSHVYLSVSTPCDSLCYSLCYSLLVTHLSLALLVEIAIQARNNERLDSDSEYSNVIHCSLTDSSLHRPFTVHWSLPFHAYSLPIHCLFTAYSFSIIIIITFTSLSLSVDVAIQAQNNERLAPVDESPLCSSLYSSLCYSLCLLSLTHLMYLSLSRSGRSYTGPE
jgi:hypothetical protein